MNNFKNISDKKKSFLISLINEFFEAFMIILGISYISIITILSKIGIINFFGAEYWGLSVIVATFGFPLLLLILLLIIYAIEEIVTAIPLAIHKIKAIYNYTYLPLTTDEIKDALDKGIISSKEDYIRLILDSLRYGITNKPSSLFNTFYYIRLSKVEICYLCKAFEEVFDSPVIIDKDMVSYINKYDYRYSPFDYLSTTDGYSIQDSRQGNESVTFAIYLNGDKYKEILETVDYPLYACQ